MKKYKPLLIVLALLTACAFGAADTPITSNDATAAVPHGVEATHPDAGAQDPVFSFPIMTTNPARSEMHAIDIHRKMQDITRGWGNYDAGIENNGIMYWGGPVMTDVVNVYLIWYGGWTNNSATSLIPEFLNNLNNSPYLNIDTTYFMLTNPNTGYNQKRIYAGKTIGIAGSIEDNYSQTKNLNSNSVFDITKLAIDNNLLPLDENGVYFVLTSSDITMDLSCTYFCGWHNNIKYLNKEIKYSLIIDPAKCMAACSGFDPDGSGNFI